MESKTDLVAIVDDDESIRKALLRVFRVANIRVEAFASATAFLDSLSVERPKCVVLDLDLPDVPGIDLLRQLAQSHEAPPVIIITADDTEPTRRECRALGSRDYLVKPIDFDRLIASVNDAVGTTKH